MKVSTLESYKSDSSLSPKTMEMDFGNIGYIEIRYLEMKRQIQRINEVGENMINAVNSLINAINKLASLVGGEAVESSSFNVNVQRRLGETTDFAFEQMEKYKEVNDISRNKLEGINNLLLQIFDSDGNVVSYTANGQEVVTTYQSVLKNLENEHQKEVYLSALTNSNVVGYRTTNNADLDSRLNAAENGWETLETMYAFFSEKGLTDEQIAGVLGNAALESGFQLEIKNPTSTAKGLFQWLNSRYPENWELETQLNHAWNEMETRKDMSGYTVNEHLTTCTTAESAAKNFAIFFEGCTEGYNGRINFANSIYNYITKMKENSNGPVAA